MQETMYPGETGEGRSSGWPGWTLAGCLLWLVLLAGWTVALLTPQPVELSHALLPEDAQFPLAKCLHVGAYALLTALAGWLRPLGPWRWLLLVVLSLHGMLTEFLQQFVPDRVGCVQDVLIDHGGLALGIVLFWLTGLALRKKSLAPAVALHGKRRPPVASASRS